MRGVPRLRGQAADHVLFAGPPGLGKTTLAGIVAGVGLDPATVSAMAAAPAIAERREADTRRAIELGVFGAPSYVIDGEIFWGQDRLEFVERKLAAG
jgi:carboxymethylenebutenolidase